ncbi:helix-turn-helix domain-containing protein [Nonomuraea dietziae]|uniref:helix-turn-helix domain-containing protein n=1 Tax=Nonomuraea dietziae TaxID=65515 RepID=UPI00343482EB
MATTRAMVTRTITEKRDGSAPSTDSLTRECTLDGLATDKLAAARARQERGEPITAIAKHLGVGRSTLYRALEEDDRPAAATTKPPAPMSSKTENEACDAATYAMATALQERRPAAYRAIMDGLTPAERDQVTQACVRATARRDRDQKG